MFKIFTENFRIWWQKPADPRKRNLHREVSLLELFYDLVYVSLLIQLTHFLAGHVNLGNIIAYVAFFFMMFWAWYNGSVYYELFANVDIKSRVVIFLQMLCILGMSIFMHGSLEDGYQGFALFYGLFLTIVTICWWRTGVHNKDLKIVLRPIIILFTIVSISFYISIFTSLIVSYYIWFVSILISIIYVVIFMVRPNAKEYDDILTGLKTISSSFVERFGLIMTIILGESISSIVSGTSTHHHITLMQALNAVASFLIIVGVWWLYFDFIARRLPKDNNIYKGLWIGIHLPTLASAGLLAVGILNILKYADPYHQIDRLLILVPLIVFQVCCLILMHLIKINPKAYKIYRVSYIALIMSIVGLVVCTWLTLTKSQTLWLAFVCLLLPIYSAITMWIKLVNLGNKDLIVKNSSED